MKEFIAGAGGRYTYSDDILNLQELALSLSEIFRECSAFIISGCTVSGNNISSGYVWLNDKVRYFEGANSVAFPYYIVQSVVYENVIYAGDANKLGRSNYTCQGSAQLPTTPDTDTGLAPAFIEINTTSAPRLNDKFFGRYSLLLNPSTTSQKVQNNVTFAGIVDCEKDIRSLKELAVYNTTGHKLSATINSDNRICFTAYLNDLSKCEVQMSTEGAFIFVIEGQEIGKLDNTGFSISAINAERISAGSLRLSGVDIANTTDSSDSGHIRINYIGYAGGKTKFRDLHIHDGKSCSAPIFSIEGSSRTGTINGDFVINSTSPSAIMQNKDATGEDVSYIAGYYWQDTTGKEIASTGFTSTTNCNFNITNSVGDIDLYPKTGVNIVGTLRIQSQDISSLFVSSTTYNTEIANKVDKIEGKGLSSTDFTQEYKKQLDSLTKGNFEFEDIDGNTINKTEGYLTTSEVIRELKKYATKLFDEYSEPELKSALENLGVHSATDADSRFGKISDLFQDYILYLTSKGLSTTDAQKTLRDKIDAPSKSDVTENYINKANKLTDLILTTVVEQKVACNHIGAAHKDEYQTKLTDTGWVQMENSGTGTDASRLFIRQIGNIVSIQGMVNTGRRDGDNIAIIPNSIQPPAYGLRCTHSDFNDTHKFNRGGHFYIDSNSRQVKIHQSGWSNAETNLNFTYFV